MTKKRRALNILIGLIMIAFAIVLVCSDPQETYRTIILFLCAGMLFDGARKIVFFLTMGHHMVGGKSELYRAIIMIDMGLFTASLTDVPVVYMMLYLVGLHLFSGVIDMMRALEAKRLKSGSWKLQLFEGMVNVILAVLCLLHIRSFAVAVLIYAAGLAWSGLIRIVRALRKTAIAYIQ